jgi:hypothetical protein
MTVRGTTDNRKQPDRHGGVSGWQLVAALAVVAVVIIATLLITKSPTAVTIVTVPLLSALGVLAGRYYLGGHSE